MKTETVKKRMSDIKVACIDPPGTVIEDISQRPEVAEDSDHPESLKSS